ncbi:MAG: hypothetical protein NXI35_33045 [bacterium]|nr:hypothetical protein [bacterium]
MRRGDLDKLRRLDPKLARQLEGVLARRDADSASHEAPQGLCGASGAGPTGWTTSALPEQHGAACEEPTARTTTGPGVRTCLGPLPCFSATPTALADSPEPPAESSGDAPTAFINAEDQAGLPEVPQVLVSTEAPPEERLAETWAGYEDDCVPSEELERRKAERAAEREAQRARDRAHAQQLGFFPGASFRRHGTGEHVPCEQLELQLDGIERRVGRASTWDEGLAASRTMESVEAQCFTVRDLGDRPDNMPSCLRGMHPDLTPSQWALLRAVVTAYMSGAMGLYEYQPILASDLGMSERALRYALNGGKDRPPGLVELGLVKRRQTWKRGSGERPSDHHYLLLQAGPSLVELLLPLTCERRAQRGDRVPRRSGYTRSSARRVAAQARQDARRARFDLGERAVRRVRGEVVERRVEPPRERREQASKGHSQPKLNCPAQNADNPVPPPSGEGGLRARRGRPPSPPSSNVSLRDETLASAPPSPWSANDSDSPAPLEHLLGDRTRALDRSAKRAPISEAQLENWRRRRARGAPVPETIDRQLFSELISAAHSAMFGSKEAESQ